MLREKTIGIVVFKRVDKGIRYLLLHHEAEYWNFPKGRQEPGETELNSALRELQEETCITEVKVIYGFKDEYDYDFDTVIEGKTREKIYKKAIFFLGEIKDQEVKISDEHIDFGWFDFETAHKRMFYQQGQDLLKRAHNFLLKQQDFVL